MTLAVVFRPEAEADSLKTRDWYERQQLGLGDAFAILVDETVDKIEAMPQMYAVGIPRCAPSKASKVPLPNLLSRVIGINRSDRRAPRES
jgi:hypothetical protein